MADSKRAMDEYVSEIFLGGRSVISMHNTCEDSLLAAPIILDLVLIAELLTRIEVRTEVEKEFHGLHPVATLLSYLTKAPLVPEGRHVTFCRNIGVDHRGSIVDSNVVNCRCREQNYGGEVPKLSRCLMLL